MRLWPQVLLFSALLLWRPAMVHANEPTWQHMQALTAPEMAGRKSGSDGARKARDYIHRQFELMALTPFHDGYFQPFRHEHLIGTTEGVNVAGWLKGGSGRKPLLS
ncbi:hypothetical protein HMF8227_02617 [Saliniradius amylolyticus]|uniref:Uncharacterized protein n=1 Tax=Saliniradius amylolyticus TaxID=2183582 RepID=A0A2S2E642_9ALTE|nr:hypothetical protein [Saliniradius amylolyticus]AWL13069.1 hypothetical protein HMF8227_02617 [Saliniradius amylolyticus]